MLTPCCYLNGSMFELVETWAGCLGVGCVFSLDALVKLWLFSKSLRLNCSDPLLMWVGHHPWPCPEWRILPTSKKKVTSNVPSIKLMLVTLNETRLLYLLLLETAFTIECDGLSRHHQGRNTVMFHG